MSKVPVNLQFELAMLWRTLNIIKNIDGLSVVDFYEKLLPTLKTMPNLSLSTYWEEVSNYLASQNPDQWKFKSIVGVPPIPVASQDGSTSEAKKSVNNLMNIPELNYLKFDERIDYKHDPLQVIHNLYGVAAAYTVDASPYNQSVLLSACLAVAVKSGRASLLLHVASMISTVISNSCDPEAPYISIDLDPLKDIVNLLTQQAQPAVALQIKSKEDSTDAEQENEVVRYEKDPLLTRGTLEDRIRADGVGSNRKGMVLSFGKADHGKLGHGDVQLHRLVPTLIESLQDVEIRKTASMSTYSVAIDTEGAVYVWGTGGPAGAVQSSKTDIQPQLLEALPLHAKVVDVSCGLGHALFLLHTGKVFSWGNGGNGRLGLGDGQDRSEACPVVLLQHERITAVQCGASHSMALTLSGKVYSWGKNTQGQCGHGNIDDHVKPTLIRKLEEHVIIQLAAGWEHSLALTKEGTIYSWGSGYKDNRRGVVPPVLGLGHNEARQSPELIASIESVKIINIACGWDHCLAVDEHGKVLSWGSGQNGKLGLGTEENVSLPCYIPTLDSDDECNNPKDAKKDSLGAKNEPKKRLFVTHLSAGCEHTAVLTRDGEVYAWGHGDGGRLGHGTNAQCLVPTKVESVALMGVRPTAVHCGDKFTMILANAPETTKSSGESVLPRKISLAASVGPNTDTNSAYFLETRTFLQENLRESDLAQMQHKLNLQTLESTQILKSLLVLMASASLPRIDTSTPTEKTDEKVPEILSLVSRFTTLSVPPHAHTNRTPAEDSDLLLRGFDREYSVECADSTYTNLLQLLDALMVPFQLSLSSFVSRSDRSSNAISAQISSLSLQSVAENVFSSSMKDMLHGNNNNSVEDNNQNSNTASFRTASVANAESAGQDAQKIVDQFESLYSLLIILAANVNVLAERCEGLKKSAKGKTDDSFHVRAKDWRNIQRELGRLMPISFEENLNTGRSAQSERSEQSRQRRRRSTGTGQDDPDPDDEDPDDFQADADAECSLGSMESEEHLLQSMVRQHQHQLGRRELTHGGDGDSRHPDHSNHHRHQQDQQSDDDDHRDFHDENSASAYEGEERDFGADSGDDSFFSGDRSRMRAGTDYDTSFGADEDRTFHGGDMSPLSNAHSHLAPARVSSARGRHQSDRVGDSSVESSRGGDWERDRDADHAPYGSRSGSPAQSLDSLTHPRNDDQIDRTHSREQEEGYLTENSYSDSQDSRYGHRGGGSKPRGGGAGHHQEEDDDMERYYEEQALGMENLDLQRAIISSMQENSSDMPYETVAYRGTALMYDGTPGRFGEGIGLSTSDSQPAIPRIRDVLNSLASRCFQAIDTLSRSGAMKEGKSFKSEASVTQGNGNNIAQDPTESTAVQSVYLLWEAVQVVTNTGYEVLYTAQDQKAVLCQLVRSPAQFLFILPGVVNGASRHNTLYASLNALFLPNEALFTVSETTNGMLVSEDSLDLRSILSFLNYVNIFIRAGNDIISKTSKTASRHGSSDNLSANAKNESASSNSLDIYAVKMHTSISAGLITLTKYLLRVLLDRIEASSAFLNDTIGLQPEQPWGTDMSKVLELVADCVASDIEILTNKVEIFDDATELRFVDSFTATVLGFLYSRVMARQSVINTVALLPTSMRLLRLFQATYDNYKRPVESKERFNAWLMGSFQWVVYHITGAVNVILHPSSALMPPPLRPASQACKELLNAADVRKHLLDASSGNNPYSWEQQVWSVLHRADPAMSRNNSTLSASENVTAADSLRLADARAKLLVGADVGLLLLNAVVGEAIALGDLSQTVFHSKKSTFVESALSELTRFLATPAGQFLEKWKRGEESVWSTLSTTAQLYVSLLHTLCVSVGLNLSNLVQLVTQASKATVPDRQNVLGLLTTSTDLTTFASLMFTSLTIVAASVECTAEASDIVNKTALLKSVAAQSKQLAASGYVLAGVSSASLIVPLAAVKEAVADSVNNAANSDKWHVLVQSHVLPAKQAIKAALLASEFWLDAAVHTQLALKVNSVLPVSIEPAHATPSSHAMPSTLAVFLFTKNLSLNTIAQLALWEEDSLKNQQYALSLSVYLSDCLQQCPEVMHYCAESLQSFGDPLEALENLHFALSNSPASAHNPRNDKTNSSPTRSSNHKVEQLLSKLDAQLVAKITSLPSHSVVSTRKDEVKRMLSGFGQPTLKQIPDLLMFLRHGMITNAQFGLDSQGVVENKAAAVAAVSLNPFSTALKKTADVITALLASHQAELSALSLQDVLCANKYINLLQATLGGLASMQGIDAQQKAHSAAQTARSSGIPGQDKAHDKSAYLHALCGVLNPLGSLMKVLVNCFQKHLLFCQAVGVQFLFPSIKAVEHSSPTLLSNVFTPQGNYSLGFWLYLPPIDVLLPERKPTNGTESTVHRIHLLSRVYETGEMNVLSLLGSDITEAASSFSLSVHVVVEDAPSQPADPASSTSKTVYLEITVAATDFNSSTRENLNISANARARAVKKVSIRSKPLESLEWISCVVELVQDSVPQSAEASAAVQNAVGGAAKAQARRNYKTKYLDTTCVALFVNNTLQGATTLSAGRSTLYQSMIIGKIPSKLGVAAGEKEQIFLTDVFWVPTSVYLSSAGSEYAKMRAFITKLGSEGLIYTPNADKEFVSNDRNDYYRNFLPVSPPSLLLETIDSAFHCASQLLELLKAHLKAVPLGSVSATGVSVGANASAVSGHRPTDGYTGNTLPLNLIPIVCSFAMDVVCIADARAQESAFQTLAALLDSFPPTVTPNESGSTVDLSKSPAGSAFNAAVQNKASLAVKQAIVFCLSLLNDFFHTHHSARNDIFELSFLTESPYALKPSSNREIWQKRLQLGRISIERSMRIAEWGIRITIDENLIASGVASLLALAVRNGLGDAKFQHDCGLFGMLLAGGGWAPTVSVGRTAQLTPRKLFLHSDARAYEQCAFPTTAYVAGGTPNRPGVWLGQCLGAYQRIDAVPGLMPLVPRTLRAAILSTEMIPTRDPFAVLTMPQLNTVLKNYSLKSADELVAILKAMVTPTAGEADKTGVNRSKPNHARALITQFESVALSDGSHSDEKSADEAQATVREKDQFYLDLMQEMAFLRLLTVQLTHAAQANQKIRTESEEISLRNQLNTLRNTVLQNLEKLLSIAVQDPVQAVSVIFSSGTFKGVQLDVLKNLLKEGDISFLERISLRLWKQYKLDINPSCESGYGTAAANTSLVQIASLAGEVVISETKIRAQTHFPTVRLLGVSIQRMTGRWFYECTLLSDGLIQMGWANSMFRCDPICGQGVGDHNHSWAFDGLRCKKWNVSCEPYGRRWKLGDTVGTLIDMDLLEIRFYLNGEDLGQAFEDFSSHDVFPALSLNLRQCVRLNFGQYKFLHPPDEMDGKPFRPVIAAIQLPKPVTGLVKPNPISPIKKAAASPGMVANSLKSPSAEPAGIDPTERGTPTVSHLTPVQERTAQGTATPQAVPMTPLRQALTSNMNTPAGAETPTTYALTPAQTPSMGPSGSLALLDPIAEASTTVAPSVTFSTPPRTAPSAEISAALVIAENQSEEQENEAAAQMQMEAWDAAQQRHQAAVRARASLAQDPYLVQRDGARYGEGEGEEEEGELGEEDADDAEGLERELQRELEEHERELLAEREYEREEDREEEDDDDDDDEDDEEMDAEDELRERNRDNDDLDEAEEVNAHLLEMRRQAMIENLVNMGLPEEWAIRAAQQTDISRSETAAITWIIERMELEQSGHAGGMSQEEEDFDESEQDLDYFMNRNPAAFRLQRSESENSGTSGPAGGNMALSTHSQRLLAMQRGVNPIDGNNSSLSGGMSGLASGSGVSPGGSPTREEIYGLRRNLANVLAEDDAVSRGTTKSTSMGKVAARGMSTWTNGSGPENKLFDEMAGATPWNADLSVPPVLIGQYVARRRHDQDKQEVLAQVVELDQADMLPIIIACEFSLCIYYARAVLLRSAAFIDHKFLVSDVDMESVAKSIAESKNSSDTSSDNVSHEQKQVISRLNGAINQLGMPLLASLLMHSSSEPLVIVELFKISFKQHVVGLTQPDRLFPLIANGNILGEARDRVPLISPFASANVNKLHSALARLELQLFHGLEGTLAVDESSMQGLDTLSRMLDVAIYFSNEVPLPALINSGSPLSITSNLRELQSQLLRNLGVSVDAEDHSWVDKFAAGCKVTLYNLVHEALECLQAATSAKFDSFDWILLSLDRHEKPAEPLVPPSSFKAEAASLLSQQHENAPAVAYAYWLLRSVLVKSEMYNLHAKNKSVSPKSEATNGTESGLSRPEAKSTGSDFSPNRAKASPAGRSTSSAIPSMSAIDYLTSADTLAKLLKISATQNVSLRFCAHDLSALILSRVNVTLSETMAQSASETAEAGAPSPQIAASEYYITIAKEKRMLQMFGAHMKAEVQNGRMITRYTRSVGAFLFQWHLLRRQLGLSSVNYMHEYLMADLSIHTEGTAENNIAKPSAYSRTATSDLAEALTMSPQTLQRSQRKEASPEKNDPIWYGVRITQLTSNSVTVDWSLDPVKFPPRIKMPEFGLEYAPAPATTHEANLYFTPASHMGLEAPVLVLSGLEQNGTFHIDDLDADTLYKITITKDNAMNTSSDQEDEGEDSELAAHQEITLAMQARSVALLSYFDNGAPISSPQKDAAVPVLTAHSPASSVEATPAPLIAGQITDTKSGPTASVGAVDTVLAPYSPASTTAGKSLAPFPALLDLQPHSARGTSADRSAARLKTSSGSANPIVKSGGELVRVEEPEVSSKDEVMMFISTESEAPFQFDLDNMSPNLLVSPHSLTLLNQSNKKWSTARANVRLNSGVHRWDVHIDRCVSKNIFIGVAAREAHLNNYVGCDKHGWAFLANKAVWHNKGKTKTYGDLFRSGDTVTVILDLDEGTLSFNLNNKPMGVAVEGLVGPLYPAFSLYNEGDQLTVVKVRSAAGESGGAGSCAAEKILERIETFNNLLTCVAESFKVESSAGTTNVSDGDASSNDVLVSPAAPTVTITEELGEELLQRWELWKAEIPMRSFLVGNDFVTICASAPQCHVLSRGLLLLWDSVILQKELAVVVGVGQHRLWFRTQSTGALSGFTADSIQHMHDKGTLHRSMTTREARVYCTANHIAPFEKSPHVTSGLNSEIFGFELSATAMKEAVSKLQMTWKASDDVILMDYLNASTRKYASDPFNLSIGHVISANGTENEVFHTLSAKYTTETVVLRALVLIHFNDLALPLLPILCPFSCASEEGPFFADALLLNKLSTEAAGNHPTSMMKTMRGLFFSQIKREFALRLTSSATNSSMTIVRPPMSICNTITDAAAGRDSAPSSEKLGGRVLQSILQTLKEDSSKLALSKAVDGSPDDRTRQSPHHFPFITAGEGDLPMLTPFQVMTPSTALTHPNSVLAVTPADRSFFKFPVGDSPALTASTASLILPTGHCGLLTSTLDFVDVDQILVLEVTEEATLGKHLYESALSKEVQLQILLDERWKLLTGFQCSYVGQMMSYFEQVAGLNPNSAATLPETAANTKGARNKGLQSQLLQLQQGGNAAAWESCLKVSTEGMGLLWPCDTLLAAQRSVPFIIRAIKSNGIADSIVPTKLFQWLQIAERNPEKVSEWTLFAVFVDEACSQVRRVVESLFDSRNGHLRDSALLCTDAAMLNLSLQLFQAAGVLVGLALRTGVPIYLPLPAYFYAVLSNTSAADASATAAALDLHVEAASSARESKASQLSEDVSFALAMAVRTGVIATFPEPALDLLSYDEVRGLLTGEAGYGPPSVLLLHRHATYEAPLCAEDPHIMLFWAAMYELPTKNVQALLKQLMPPTTSFARVQHVLHRSKHLSSSSSQEPFCLHILPPTAVAMLSPDVSEIVLFADRCALALPRYSNLKVMIDYLHRVSTIM